MGGTHVVRSICGNGDPCLLRRSEQPAAMTRHYDPIGFDSGSAPWIFLSPHLDDAAYSCGGLISRQVRDGLDVAIWTVFTASPPQRLSAFAQRFHAVWGIDGDPMAWRKGEDRASCDILGARCFHLDFPDVVHRWSDAAGSWLYTSDQQVTARVHPVDAALVHDLADRLRATLPGNATVVCPLALGDHVDHQITRLAAERVGRDLAYYADYPYVRKQPLLLEPLERKAWIACSRSLNDGAVTAWQDAALAHRSQVNGYWTQGDDQLRRDIADYGRSKHGAALWYPPAPNRASAGEERTRDEGLSFAGSWRPSGARECPRSRSSSAERPSRIPRIGTWRRSTRCRRAPSARPGTVRLSMPVSTMWCSAMTISSWIVIGTRGSAPTWGPGTRSRPAS